MDTINDVVRTFHREYSKTPKKLKVCASWALTNDGLSHSCLSCWLVCRFWTAFWCMPSSLELCR